MSLSFAAARSSALASSRIEDWEGVTVLPRSMSRIVRTLNPVRSASSSWVNPAAFRRNRIRLPSFRGCENSTSIMILFSVFGEG
jgi:hypothetical protein